MCSGPANVCSHERVFVERVFEYRIYTKFTFVNVRDYITCVCVCQSKRVNIYICVFVVNISIFVEKCDVYKKNRVLLLMREQHAINHDETTNK